MRAARAESASAVSQRPTALTNSRGNPAQGWCASCAPSVPLSGAPAGPLRRPTRPTPGRRPDGARRGRVGAAEAAAGGERPAAPRARRRRTRSRRRRRRPGPRWPGVGTRGLRHRAWPRPAPRSGRSIRMRSRNDGFPGSREAMARAVSSGRAASATPATHRSPAAIRYRPISSTGALPWGGRSWRD